MNHPLQPRWRHVPRLLPALVTVVLVWLPLLPATPAHAADADSPRLEDASATTGPLAQQLADRYAPIVYTRVVNNDMCSRENEGFSPVAVDFVLGREEIPLLVSDNGLPSGPRSLVANAPQARDLYGLPAGNFLDFPGSPINPGCVYRRYHADRLATEQVDFVAYAHIYLEPGEDELALQYWMFYYFNDWNNDHEGDWEMIMLYFDATTVEEALAQEPVRVVYAQHGGGERIDWDDDRLSLEDGRPVVYSARGAHASFYEQNVYFGLAEDGTGFGCETTEGPHKRYDLAAVVVPHEPSGPDDPFAWLAFDGRWGEFRRSEWNGPTGPNDKRSWTQPVTWGNAQRTSSLIVPQFEGLGQGPIDLFCGIVAVGSRVLVAFTATPLLIGGGLLMVGVIVAWVFGYTSTTVRAAFGYYRRHLRIFGVIGLAMIPTGYLVAVLQTMLFRIPPIGPFVQMMERFPGIRILLLLGLGSLQAAVAVLFIAPTVIWMMSQMRAGQTPSLVDGFRNGLSAIGPIFVARVRVGVRIVLYAVTIVGIPLAIRRFVRAFFLPQAVIHERDDSLKAIEDSALVVSVNYKRTALTQVVLALTTLLTGPMLAIFLLLLIPSRPLGLVNYISSLLFAFLYPVGVIGMTLLYFELRPAAAEAVAGGEVEG